MNWWGPKWKPVKEIRSQDGVLHFRRWQILSTRYGDLYLHFINAPDEDAHLHDHPWDFTTLILRGGYTEVVLEKSGTLIYTDARPRTRLSRTTDMFHKVLKLHGPTWTLVWTGPRTHDLWGYTTPEGFIDHITYRKRKREGSLP